MLWYKIGTTPCSARKIPILCEVLAKKTVVEQREVPRKEKLKLGLTYHRLQHVLRNGVNFKLANNGGIDGGDLGHVVIPPLTLFLLKLDGNTTNGALLNSLHQMSNVSEKQYILNTRHRLIEY